MKIGRYNLDVYKTDMQNNLDISESSTTKGYQDVRHINLFLGFSSFGVNLGEGFS
jgi:hypothetical protein